VTSVLVAAGSLRRGSWNAALAAEAARALEAAGASVTHVSLADYPLPLYDADLEREAGLPEAARRLAEAIAAHDGLFLASPEYNAGVTPLLKNAIDWASRVRDGGPPVFTNKVTALSSASNGQFGGMRGLLMLRQILGLGLGAFVIPQQFVLPGAASAFDEAGGLRDEAAAKRLAGVAGALVSAARRLGAEA